MTGLPTPNSTVREELLSANIARDRQRKSQVKENRAGLLLSALRRYFFAILAVTGFARELSVRGFAAPCRTARRFPERVPPLPTAPTTHATRRTARGQDRSRAPYRCRQTERAVQPFSERYQIVRRQSATASERSKRVGQREGCAEPVVRLDSNRELPRNTTPAKRPIQCRIPSECPTTVPAMWRDGRTWNAVGASTKERKIIPPIQTVRDRNRRKRRMDIRKFYAPSAGRSAHRLLVARPVCNKEY